LKPTITIICCLLIFSSCRKKSASPTGTLKITFQNLVAGNPIVLNTTTYVNPFLEIYTIKKFRYYISNVTAGGGGNTTAESNSYHLIDQSIPSSLTFSFPVNVGTSSSLSFVLGVDSIRNVSGAQTGALDPTNDMFWTWSSGYVMAKMEGNSPASTLVNNLFEFHIGGFSGVNNVLKTINLTMPSGQALDIHEGKTSEIIIHADANSWWQGSNDMRISANPSITSPGILAKQMSDNYRNMFTVLSVTNN
jgi:hypothetical protein